MNHINAVSLGRERDSDHPCSHLVPPVRQEVVRRSHKILSPLMKKYFRSEIRGAEKLPSSQTIVITHHDGGVLPINGICFGVAWYDAVGFDRPLYILSHDILHKLWDPFSKLLADSGMLPADRNTMDGVLSKGGSCLLFPGAARETFRPYWERRNIDLGGRKGFVQQAIRWKVPITPVVSAGAHETVFILSGGRKFAKAIGIQKLVRSIDAWPLQAGLPWGVWGLPFLPQFPLPAKITTEVLDPIHLDEIVGRELRPEDADNPAIVQKGFDVVVSRMRERVNELYDERKYPVIG
jgi:1-acyl-sn-glycerol-3-phosphate acyltransferase